MADTDLAAVARRRQNRFFAVALPLWVLSVPVAGLVGFAAGGSSLADLPPMGWLLLAAFAIPPLFIVGALAWARRRGVRALQPPLAWGLSWAERREISKAIKANRPVSEHPEIAREIARRMARGWWIAYPVALVGLVFLVLRFLVDGQGTDGFLAYIAPVMSLVLAPFIWLEAKRAQRWLDEHGQEEMA